MPPKKIKIQVKQKEVKQDVKQEPIPEVDIDDEVKVDTAQSIIKSKQQISEPIVNENESKIKYTDKNDKHEELDIMEENIDTAEVISKENIKENIKENGKPSGKINIKEHKIHNHSKPKTISASTKVDNTVDMFGEDDLDFRYIMMNYDYTKNVTMPKITKYERALLIGKRAKQIEEGANPNVKYTSGQSVISIAEEELRQRKIPLIIKRPIGNKFEYWKPADMEVNMD